MSDIYTFSLNLANQDLIVETGRLATQAGGAVTLRIGDTMLLATATMSKLAREGLDFFPLSVDFEEKMYAVGKIPGSFFRREARPSTEAILTARLTDRPIRPLFPKNMRNEVQVIITALSSDSVHHLDIASVNAASMALSISDIPWGGPIGAVRVGLIDGQLVLNPTIVEMENSELDLRLAGTRDAIIMVEAGANEVSEETLISALEFGHQGLQPLIDLQIEMKEKVGKEKSEAIFDAINDELEAQVKAKLNTQIKDVAVITDRHHRNEVMDSIRETLMNEFLEEDENVDLKAIREVIASELKKEIRQRVIKQGIRPDGRGTTDIRELSAEVGLTPRTHGSGLFKRGETHCLSIVSLGTPREALKLDGLYPEDSRRFMLHYNFPPYSTGETWVLRGPKRREIGHGMLGRTALVPVIPSEEKFPYTIRVVSEIMSSNGSTSQASICAASLALMDCGVPIKKPVAGIAMGLVTDGKNHAILSDIQGLEDHLGDMDFKVAGTTDGVTALQMDIKINGLSTETMASALEQARQGRLHILQAMASVMSAPRETLSKWAPRMTTIQIPPSKIGAVIGKSGATIRSLEQNYEVSVDIQEDGTIFIAGVDGEKTDQAVDFIQKLTEGAKLGEIYTGKVVRIESFGAFIEIIPGLDGMCHISQLSTERLNKVEDAARLGDEIMVMVTDIDPSTEKVRLSRQAVLEGWTLEEAREKDSGGKKPGGNNRRSGSGNRNDNRRNNRSSSNRR